MKKTKWTIIIIANLENNSFLTIPELYNDISQNIIDSEEVNFILLFDDLRITVDEDLNHTKYFIYNRFKYSLVSIFEVKKGSSYFSASPIFSESDHRRDNFYDINNLKFYLNLIKEKYPANNYGLIYKSHGGNHTDMIDRFVESLIFKVKSKEEALSVLAATKNNTEYTPNERIEKVWGKKHSSEWWNAPEIEILESDVGAEMQEPLPSICLLTYKGKNRGKDFAELSYKSFAGVLQNCFGENGIQFFLFDCCWGMRYEVASLFRNVSKYIVGSMDESPLVGIGYDIWTRTLTRFPDMRSEEVAKMLVAQFYASRFNDYIDPTLPDPAAGSFYKYGLSMACIEMDKFDQTAVLFTSIIDALTYLLKDEETSEKITRLIKTSRDKCKDFTYGLEPDAYPIFNIDLIWFLENMIYNLENYDIADIPEHKHILEDLNLQMHKLIKEIKLKLIIAYCQNNYQTPSLEDNESYTGGYGITVTFPSSSLFETYWNLGEFDNFPEYLSTGWTDFLLRYYKNIQKFEL